MSRNTIKERSNMPQQSKQWQHSSDNAAIIKAITENNFHAVQEFIIDDLENLLVLSDETLSPLYLACILGYEDIVRYLIEIEKIMALDLDYKAIGIGNLKRKEGPKNLNAIQYTQASNYTKQPKKLAILVILNLEENDWRRPERNTFKWSRHQSRTDTRSKYKWQSMSTNSALIIAIQKNDFETVMQLIKVDKSCLFQRSVPGFSPLHVACLLGHAEIALHILDQEKLLVQQDPTLAKIGIGDPNRVESNTLPMSARDCLQYSFSYKENRHQQLNPLLESLESSAARVTEEREHALAQRHINTNKSSGHQLHLLTPHRNNPNQETTSIAADEHCKICTIS